MIDLHSHILPGIDDGPGDLAGSLQFARAAVEAGTRKIAATPHIDHLFGIAPEDVAGAVGALNAELGREGIDLEVVPGGEVAMSRAQDLGRESLEAVRLGGGPYVLLEAPLTQPPDGLRHVAFQLGMDGHRILLAHPERSVGLQRDPALLRDLVGSGVLTSITSASLEGRFGGPVRRFSLWMLEEGLVHDVASDAHDHRRRAPGILAGLQHADRDLPGIADQAEWFTEEAPAAILAGERVGRPPEPPRRRGGLLRRLRSSG